MPWGDDDDHHLRLCVDGAPGLALGALTEPDGAPEILTGLTFTLRRPSLTLRGSLRREACCGRQVPLAEVPAVERSRGTGALWVFRLTG